MTAAPVELDYAEIHETGYEDLAAKTFVAQFVPNSDSPSDIYVSGPCPRCTQPMTFRHPVLIVRGIDRVEDATAAGLWDLVRQQGGDVPTEWSFTAYCHCRVKHPKAPEDATGCGAFWGMTVTRPPEERPR